MRLRLAIALVLAASVPGACGRSAISALRLRGGALWVKGPEDSKQLQIVHSLAKFCEEHALDEEAMRAVARGEATDHNGWDCGELCEFDSADASADAGADADADVKAEEAVEVEEVGEKEEAAAAAETAPPQMNQMLIKMGLPMIASQLLKRADKESPLYLPALRSSYCGSVVACLAVQQLLAWRISSANDTSMVERPMDPMSMLMGGGAAEPQTAGEYDRSQLKSMRTSMQLGVVITLVMHFKFGMTQPLIYQAVSSLVELYYHPLVQVHLLGKPTTGALKRPFGSVKPDMSAMLKNFGLQPPPLASQPAAAGGDAK